MPEAEQQQNSQQGGGANAAAAATPTTVAPLAFKHASAPESWASRVFTRDDLRKHASIGKFKSMDELGASYLALEKRVGATRPAAIPGPDATDEQREAFFDALGRPEAADKYTIAGNLKDVGVRVDENFARGAFKAFHQAGLNDAQATAVTEFYIAQQQAASAAETARTETTIRQLKNQFGRDFDSEMRVATAAMNALAHGKHRIPGMQAFAENPTFGNHPVIIRLFNRLGTLMGESGKRASAPSGGLEAKKAELMKRGGPYWNGRHPDHARHVDEVAKINQQLTRAL